MASGRAPTCRSRSDRRSTEPARPAAVQRVADSAAVRRAARAGALPVSALVVAAAFLGPAEPDRNLAPWALYVTFWVGLVPASLLLGQVWRYANPLRLLTRVWPACCRRPPARSSRGSGCGRPPSRSSSSCGSSWCCPLAPSRPSSAGSWWAGRSCTWRWPLASGRTGSPGATASRSAPPSSPGSRPGDGARTGGWCCATPSAARTRCRRPLGWPPWSSSCWGPPRSTGCRAPSSGRPAPARPATSSPAPWACSR